MDQMISNYTPEANRLARLGIFLGACSLLISVLTWIAPVSVFQHIPIPVGIVIFFLVTATAVSIAVLALVLSHRVIKQGARQAGSGATRKAYVGFGLAVLAFIPSAYLLAAAVFGIVVLVA